MCPLGNLQGTDEYRDLKFSEISEPTGGSESYPLGTYFTVIYNCLSVSN